jgi:uncharacterized damage-inducible protein DinB
MTELETVQAFYRLNSTVRQHYLEAILALPAAERLKDRGASYPSLQGIYVHVLDGLRYWLELVPQDRVAEASAIEYPAQKMTPEALRAASEETDRIVLAYVLALREGALELEIVAHFPGDTGPVAQRFPTGDVLWHMVEEEFQHRGELNALLWQIDVEPPIGTYAEWRAARAASRSAGAAVDRPP